ncbi:hypothetical protein GOBAR_AA25729 [Gossypium barbadense]|uniref:Uncharacterized protein n=1 Tax=Gossypium barbadense TaxID=3634 RepID=A0A2P5WV25_GOSBA|nr:hypothetical protein GOBAR_AA25729 [Gossypium barbadense]
MQLNPGHLRYQPQITLEECVLTHSLKARWNPKRTITRGIAIIRNNNDNPLSLSTTSKLHASYAQPISRFMSKDLEGWQCIMYKSFSDQSISSKTGTITLT